MIFNCGIIFILLLGLGCLAIFMSGKRQNLCLLFSFATSIIITFFFYLLFNAIGFPMIINNAIFWLFYNPLKSINDPIIITQFTKGFLYLLIFIVFSIISYFLLNIFISPWEAIRKKNQSHYAIRFTLCGINSILFALSLLFILCDLNMALMMEEGFLSGLFRIMEKVIYQL